MKTVLLELRQSNKNYLLYGCDMIIKLTLLNTNKEMRGKKQIK